MSGHPKAKKVCDRCHGVDYGGCEGQEMKLNWRLRTQIIVFAILFAALIGLIVVCVIMRQSFVPVPG